MTRSAGGTFTERMCVNPLVWDDNVSFAFDKVRLNVNTRNGYSKDLGSKALKDDL